MKAKNKECKQARKLRQQGWSLNKIANELKVSKGSISCWVRDIKLTKEQQEKLNKRNPIFILDTKARKKNAKKASETWRNKRREYQKIGAQRIKNNNPLYVAGCMLYWAEGAKSRTAIRLTNSDPLMLKFFIKFLKGFWNVTNNDIVLQIHAYTDIHSKKEIEKYWLSQLDISQDNLKKTQCLKNHLSNRKTRRCEWGICHIKTNNVSSVAIIQEIYGAIKEYASIDDENRWLD